MAKKVIIEVSDDIWEGIPIVARHIHLPSDAQNSATVSVLFDRLMEQAIFEAEMVGPGPTVGYGSNNDALQALNELLDPSIARDVVVTKLHEVQQTGLTLFEWFEQYATQNPNDSWLKEILSKPEEEQMLWKLALSATYQVIQGDERKTPDTWRLIDRTYQLMLKKD